MSCENHLGLRVHSGNLLVDSGNSAGVLDSSVAWNAGSHVASAHLAADRSSAALPAPTQGGIENRVERVIIRDARQVGIFCDVDDWTVQKLLGGLTDEPISMEALLECAAQFGPLAALTPLSIASLTSDAPSQPAPSQDAPSQDAPSQDAQASGSQLSGSIARQALHNAYGLSHHVASWIWIDLEARMVVQWLPVFNEGLFQSDAELSGASEVVYTLLPPDWRLDSVANCPNWFEVIARRVDEHQRQSAVETQAVLWGRDLMRDWVEQVREFRLRVGEDVWRSLKEEKTIWLQQKLISLFLTTERADLGGATPEDALAESRHFVAQACQYRRELWVHFGRPPRSRSLDHTRCRPTRFGTVQNRIILELFDYLLERIQSSPWTTPRSSVQEWLSCVETWKQKFLEGCPEGSVWSRLELIELEQAFMPIPLERVYWKWERGAKCEPVVSLRGELKDMGGFDSESRLPRFEEVLGFEPSWEHGVARELSSPWQSEFVPGECVVVPIQADDLLPSKHEQPPLKESSRDERDERMDAKDGRFRVDEYATVWKHSYLNWDAEWPVKACYSFLVMRISFLVSEILMELHRADDHWQGQELIARFSGLQRAGDNEDAEAFEVAANLFCELLEELTNSYPELVPRLADLQSRLWEQIQKLVGR